MCNILEIQWSTNNFLQLKVLWFLFPFSPRRVQPNVRWNVKSHMLCMLALSVLISYLTSDSYKPLQAEGNCWSKNVNRILKLWFCWASYLINSVSLFCSSQMCKITESELRMQSTRESLEENSKRRMESSQWIEGWTLRIQVLREGGTVSEWQDLEILLLVAGKGQHDKKMQTFSLCLHPESYRYIFLLCKPFLVYAQYFLNGKCFKQ